MKKSYFTEDQDKCILRPIVEFHNLLLLLIYEQVYSLIT